MEQAPDRTAGRGDPDRGPDQSVIEAAAGWLAHLESGDVDAEDRAAFTAWLGADPAHRLAIDRMGGLPIRSAVERETLRQLFLRPSLRTGAIIPIVLLLAAAGWFIGRQPAVQIQFADQRTARGEIHPVALTDGSRVVLATESAADIDQEAGRRTVHLLRGEVLAEVAPGKPQPFIVETADGTAEALGTAFTVRKEEAGTVVAVIESHVRACPATGDREQCIVLAPGERARIAAGVVRRLASIDPGTAGAWSDGWLPVEDRPLVEVLDELNRWRAAPVRFDRNALASLRVSGILPLRDTDRALANLSRSQPITIDRSDPDAVRVEPR